MTVSERVASGASGCTQIRPTTLSTFGASREEKQECHWDSDQKKSMVELLPIRHILDIFAELVWKSRWRAQNLIVKHHVPMTEWQFWRWIMLDPLFQRQCSGSSMYHTWPTLGWFSEMFMMIWIYLDISGYIWMISSTTMGEEIPTWRSTRFSFQFPCRASHLDECPQPENPTGGGRGSFTTSSVRRFAVKHLRRVGLIYC